jgi:hypothetical protein
LYLELRLGKKKRRISDMACGKRKGKGGYGSKGGKKR